MEPQHCMLCWSCVIADAQSANCKPNKATNATTMRILLLITLKSNEYNTRKNLPQRDSTVPFCCAWNTHFARIQHSHTNSTLHSGQGDAFTWDAFTMGF